MHLICRYSWKLLRIACKYDHVSIVKHLLDTARMQPDKEEDSKQENVTI